MEIERKLSPKTCYLPPPYLQQAAPVAEPQGATQPILQKSAVRKGSKGRGHPPQTLAAGASTGSLVVGVCKRTSAGCVTLERDPIRTRNSCLKWHHLTGLRGER